MHGPTNVKLIMLCY